MIKSTVCLWFERDAEAAALLSAELGYPVDASTMRARLAHLSHQDDHGIFVACRGGRVVGWVHVLATHPLQAAPRAEIGGLVVSADSRSGGLGAALVALYSGGKSPRT